MCFETVILILLLNSCYVLSWNPFGGGNANLSTTQAPSCEDAQTVCDDGKCIKKGLWCDAYPDCDDESDEKYCPNNLNTAEPCKDIHFQCYSGGCVPINDRCDGVTDCEDDSDELSCDVFFDINIDKIYDDKISGQFPLSKGAKWILSQRQADYGWKYDTPRALVALTLASAQVNEDEKRLMLQQLAIELTMELIMDKKNAEENEGNTIELFRYAQYINALIAMCQNPRNFHGHDLVQSLRTLANKAIKKSSIAPGILLTLCLVHETEPSDIHVAYAILNSHRKVALKHYGLKFYAAIAAACMLQSPNHINQVGSFKSALKPVLSNFDINKTDIHTAALLLQALNAWTFYPEFGYLKTEQKHLQESLQKMQRENGSFGDFLATYYAVPAINGKSLLDLMDVDCSNKKLASITEDPLLGETRIKINISMWIGGNYVTEIHSMAFDVPSNWTLFEAMQFAAKKNPIFKFRYDKTKYGKMIYAVANLPDDYEKSVYWKVYKNQLPEVTQPLNYLAGIDKIKLHNGDDIILLYCTSECASKI